MGVAKMSASQLKSPKTSLPLCSANGIVENHWKSRIEGDSCNNGKKKLRLKGRELQSVPREIFDLSELQVLEMSPKWESCLNYKMGSVPREIGQLRALTVLNLDTNDLREIPPDIGSLENLEILTLSNNQLSCLPAEMEKLQKLQSLHLANNNFLELPVQVCQLCRLTFLDACDNKIKFIPHSICNLKYLETLLLYFNALQSLPDSICNLTLLRTLWLGNNNLRNLPVKFGHLVNLDWGRSYSSSNFEGNPLESPPAKICRGGPEEIRRYFAMWQMKQNDQVNNL
ncbi:plant intracellular Ras-group-related LRR protein 7-like isoform X1 [Amblyraja radiata]|uniref:plant intracellular Ras-group-related LRR protein 7-like isoform X1 n=2 Tax=Amblyraja radiata TaxID=386614 RepID=UPI001403322E|nr:plant intracellular Ras-group-related LRR protein 7-like isoform X1 [Amblyraja radiata]